MIQTFHKKSKYKIRLVTRIYFWLLLIYAVMLISGYWDFPAHNDEVFLGIMAIGSAFVLYIPWLLQFVPEFSHGLTERKVMEMEAILGLAMLLSWIGSMGMYRAGIGYDTFVHFTTSFLGVFFFFMVLESVHPDFKRRHSAILFLLLVTIVLFAGYVNEMFEFYSDLYLGTRMSGEIGQPNDTTIDYIADAIGAIFGAITQIKYRKI